MNGKLVSGVNKKLVKFRRDIVPILGVSTLLTVDKNTQGGIKKMRHELDRNNDDGSPGRQIQKSFGQQSINVRHSLRKHEFDEKGYGTGD